MITNSKLQHRPQYCILLFLSLSGKSFKVWYPKNLKTEIYRDVIFYEQVLLCKDKEEIVKDIEHIEKV